jgi:hypothetical protein
VKGTSSPLTYRKAHNRRSSSPLTYRKAHNRRSSVWQTLPHRMWKYIHMKCIGTAHKGTVMPQDTGTAPLNKSKTTPSLAQHSSNANTSATMHRPCLLLMKLPVFNSKIRRQAWYLRHPCHRAAAGWSCSTLGSNIVSLLLKVHLAVPGRRCR